MSLRAAGPLALLLACLALATGAADRAAAKSPQRDPDVRSWLRVAERHWKRSPGCVGGVGVVRAQWSPDPGAWAAAFPGGCFIALDPDYYPRPTALAPDLWKAAMCSVIAHEWGHLLGEPHSSDPRSLMAPAAPLYVVAGCPGGPKAKTSGKRRKAKRSTKRRGRASRAAKRR